MKFISSSVVFLLVSTVAMAQNQESIAQRLDEQRVPDATPLVQPLPPAPASTAPRNTPNTLHISKTDLAKRPDLIIRSLVPALLQHQVEHVQLLWPLYQALPSRFQDPQVQQWAQALLAKHHRQHAKAIRLYRQLLALRPDILALRLQLAMALFEDRQFEAAQDQFQRLGAHPQAPQDLITHYLGAMRQQQAWQWQAGINLLHEPNINNAPTQQNVGNWTAPRPESASGLGGSVHLRKQWQLGNGRFVQLRGDSWGKWYINNAKYNELKVRGALALGVNNSRSSLAIVPFADTTFYGGGNSRHGFKHFSHTLGLGIEGDRWLSHRLQIQGLYEWSRQRYVRRQHLNGDSHFLSVSALYLPHAQQSWQANLNWTQSQVRSKEDSYTRYGAQLSWQQEWRKGLSTRATLGYGHKHYWGPSVFQVTQAQHELSAQLSVWHRALHIWGITPRLNYSVQQVLGNHPMYTYKKHRIFVDLHKRF